MVYRRKEYVFDKGYMKIISANIRKYRKLAGITQEQLAIDIDRHYDYVRKLEWSKGAVDCSLDTLNRIATVLEVPMYKFLIEESN